MAEAWKELLLPRKSHTAQDENALSGMTTAERPHTPSDAGSLIDEDWSDEIQ